jgi:DNA-binding NarL/FixJ family response regulator
MGKIKIMIADDHPAFCKGLCRIIEGEDDMEVIAEAADGIKALSLAKELKPDVAIIDVAMPHITGIEAAKQIKEACPGTSILMLSAYDYDSYILASLRAGALGYLLKDALPREIIYAIRLVRAGKTVFDLRPQSDIVHHLTANSDLRRKDFERLSNRELDVLKIVAKGVSNKDMASELVISERTVQTHLTNIFRKLGVSSRTEAVLCALKKHLLTLDELSLRERYDPNQASARADTPEHR